MVWKWKGKVDQSRVALDAFNIEGFGLDYFIGNGSDWNRDGTLIIGANPTLKGSSKIDGYNGC
ncbi:unnamed protein product, partial [Dovyalis caffra]